MSIICKIQPNNEQEYVLVNFLPYPRGNRDEWISKGEVSRISGAFVNNESIINKDLEPVQKALKGLRDYFCAKFGGGIP